MKFLQAGRAWRGSRAGRAQRGARENKAPGDAAKMKTEKAASLGIGNP